MLMLGVTVGLSSFPSHSQASGTFGAVFIRIPHNEQQPQGHKKLIRRKFPSAGFGAVKK
jgi:hypothetical protein